MLPTDLKSKRTNVVSDSLVSSHVYEIIRTIYSTPSTDADESSRIAALQSTLSQLRLTNIATLDACMNHFTRLIDLTSADETYVASLASALAPCILRPRTETSLTMEEKHAYRLVRDLFAHKDAIFSALKRMSMVNHSSSVGSNNRPRAISTDESNRKALMEERNRALLEKANASRGRDKSPAPGPRGHRRDRSTGGPETRFPIASPTSASAVDRHRTSLGGVIKRQSLEVPEPDGAAPVNGEAEKDKSDADSDKRDSRDSTGRTPTKFVGGKRVPVVPSTPSTPPSDSTRGVQLEDAPMED
jgi:hypothetical protein